MHYGWKRMEPPDSRQRGLTLHEESYQIDDDPLNLFQYIRTEATTIRARLTATAINFPRRPPPGQIFAHHTRPKESSTSATTVNSKSSTTLSTTVVADVDPDHDDSIIVWLLILFIIASYAFQVWRRQSRRERVIRHQNHNV